MVNLMNTAAVAIGMTVLLAACQVTSPYLWDDPKISDQFSVWTWTSGMGPIAERQAHALADAHCNKYGKKAMDTAINTKGFTREERALRQRQFQSIARHPEFGRPSNLEIWKRSMFGSPAGRQAGGGLDRLYQCID